MKNQANHFNFGSPVSFDPSEDSVEVPSQFTNELNSKAECDSFEARLRSIWKRQLSSKEEKFSHRAVSGQLAQTLLAGINSSVH